MSAGGRFPPEEVTHFAEAWQRSETILLSVSYM